MDNILNDFLPDKIFDAHAHLYADFFKPNVNGFSENALYENYNSDMKELLLGREVHANFIPFPTKSCKDFLKIDEFIFDQTSKDASSVCEISVTPYATYDEIKKRIKGKKFSGFKCYHTFKIAENTFNLGVGAYLTHDIMALADELNKVITIHFVKEDALLDEENASFIKENAKKYKNATFILAHCGRAFAGRTAVEGAKKYRGLDNVWFDFSAICESPAIFSVIKSAGVEKCMFGTDYPICNLKAKSVSYADKFFWLYEKDFLSLGGNFPTYKLGKENLMAIREAFIMLDLKAKDVEKVFYNNAYELFKKATEKTV